jgi:hypothetical protein
MGCRPKGWALLGFSEHIAHVLIDPKFTRLVELAPERTPSSETSFASVCFGFALASFESSLKSHSWSNAGPDPSDWMSPVRLDFRIDSCQGVILYNLWVCKINYFWPTFWTQKSFFDFLKFPATIWPCKTSFHSSRLIKIWFSRQCPL